MSTPSAGFGIATPPLPARGRRAPSSGIACRARAVPVLPRGRVQHRRSDASPTPRRRGRTRPNSRSCACATGAWSPRTPRTSRASWSRSRTPREAPCLSASPTRASLRGSRPDGWTTSSSGSSTWPPTTAIRRSGRSFARRCCRMPMERRCPCCWSRSRAVCTSHRTVWRALLT